METRSGNFLILWDAGLQRKAIFIPPPDFVPKGQGSENFSSQNSQVVGSFPDDFDENSLSSLAVEFSVKNLLPGAEIHFSGRHGDHDLVMDQKGFQMSVPVGFARAVVAVIRA